MALRPGSKLGPYDIVAPLGAGGMGEVYRARDTRLHRDVAIKVLPPDWSRDAERLRRFEQEARAAAALTHPNVVAVFDVGVEGDQPYVVSELLEGETLGSLLKQGALPARKALDVAVQIGLGLAAAHEKGIVHRDLKPDNIFITGDGRAKILDFGLAKLVEGVASTPERATTTATGPGVVLGTVGYMAPEQVRGEEADHRADIFAFGVVFYEMLAGRRAFSGQSAVETMTAILREDPPELPATVIPPHLNRVVRRCLEKSPAHRFQSASDIAYTLEAMSLASGPALLPAPPPQSRRWQTIAIGAAAAAAVAVGGLAVARLASRPETVVTFEAQTFDRLPITNARYMPDGQTIVYSAAARDYAPELFAIDPNAEAPRALGVPNAHLLAVSSRGELALITGARHLEQRLFAGTLARMTVGSSPREVLQDVREADWAPDGESMAIVHDLGNGRDRLEYPAGTPLYEAGGYLSDPRVSPDGSAVAFFEHQWRFDDRGSVKVVDRSGTVTTLTGELWGLQGLAWTPDGATVVFSGNAEGGFVLGPMSVPAAGDAEARPVFGVPGRFIVHDIGRQGEWLAVREDLALGVRVRVAGDASERELSWLGSAGARALSADGQWLLMVDVGRRGGRDYGVVLRRTDASRTIRLGAGFSQALSPDGTRAAAIVAAPPQLFVYPTGPGEPTRVDTGSLERIVSAEWFPDGDRLLVCGAEAGQAPRCFEKALSGAGLRPVTGEGELATLAPDGRTLLVARPDGAFHLSSVEGGTNLPVTGLGPGDRQIAWSRDSRAVYVQQGLAVPAKVERVDLASGTRVTASELAPGGEEGVVTLYVVDWAEDGPSYAYNYTRLPSTLFVVRGAMH